MSSSSSLIVKPTSTATVDSLEHNDGGGSNPILTNVTGHTDNAITTEGPGYVASASNSLKGELFKLYYNTISTVNRAVITKLTDDKLEDNVEAWILGERYRGCNTTAWVSDKMNSVSYFTYRNRFPQQLANGGDHDAGWGCMLRTGQSMICEAVRRIMKCKNLQQVPEREKTEKELNNKIQRDQGKESRNIPVDLTTTVADLALIYGLDQEGSERAYAACSLFYDSPAAPFGIHNLTWTGVNAAKVAVGEWFTPTALARSVKAIFSNGDLFTGRSQISSNIDSFAAKRSNNDSNDKGTLPHNCIERSTPRNSSDYLIAVIPGGVGADPIPRNLDSKPFRKTEVATGDDAARYIYGLFSRLRDRMTVITAYDGTVCREEVLNVLNTPVQPHRASHRTNDMHRIGESDVLCTSTICRTTDNKTEGNSDNKAVLLLIPMMLGYGTIPTECYGVVLKILEMSSSLGIVGGKPKKSFYFVGHQQEQLFYFDPHVVQEAFVSPHTIGTRHGAPTKTVPLSDIDPCMLLGFLFESPDDYELFERHFSEVRPLSPTHLISFIMTLEEKIRKEENLLRTSLSEMEWSSDEDKKCLDD